MEKYSIKTTSIVDNIREPKGYTLKQLEGLVSCNCGSKYWTRSKQGRTRIVCVDCGAIAPDKPETTRAQVKKDFQYARLVMSIATKKLNAIGRGTDDPLLGAEFDIDELAQLANDLAGAVSTLSQYVYERGGTL